MTENYFDKAPADDPYFPAFNFRGRQMDKIASLRRLQQITGNIQPAAGSSADELSSLQRKLLEHLAADPDLTVSGNRAQPQFAQAESASDLSTKFSHLSDILMAPASAQSATTPPLVFRRETSFSSSLLGNSVPTWGSGLAPSQTFGPFLDEHGLQVWFDFFFPTRLVQVYVQGGSVPIMLIPLWGALTGKKSYRIEPGSAWIASDLIAKTSALSGYYTGLKIRGGSLDLSQNATIGSGKIIIPALGALNLHLDLDQNSVTLGGGDAGVDAENAIAHMPQTFELQVPAGGSGITAGDASCTVFGRQV
ncbi:MAG: hypothetical protein ABI988_03355, partial [Nitrospirota bacterium]